MAYQIADGFDNYGNNYTMTAGYPWATLSGSGQNVINTDYQFSPPNPLPGGCLYINNGDSWIRTNLVGTPGTIFANFGFKITALPTNGTPADIFTLWDSGTAQTSLAVTTNGALQFYRGGLGTAIGPPSTNGIIQAGSWYGLAITVVVGTGTSGSVQVSVNGSLIPAITAAGLNSSQTGNSYATQLSIGSQFNEGQQGTKYDDFLCWDNTGGVFNTALGYNARILSKLPSAAGFATNWTPEGNASNYQNVNPQPPNTTDYNLNNTSGTKDYYALPSIGLNVTPALVIVRASLERDDSNTHTPSIFVRSGSTDGSGTVTPALTSSYLFYDAIQLTDPATGLAWSASGVDAAQIGIIEG